MSQRPSLPIYTTGSLGIPSELVHPESLPSDTIYVSAYTGNQLSGLPRIGDPADIPGRVFHGGIQIDDHTVVCHKNHPGMYRGW